MGAIASQITSLTIVYSSVYSGAYQSKHQSSAPLAFVWGIHRGPVNSPHKWPVTRKMFPFDDVIIVGSSHNGKDISLVYSSNLVKLTTMPHPKVCQHERSIFAKVSNIFGRIYPVRDFRTTLFSPVQDKNHS